MLLDKSRHLVLPLLRSRTGVDFDQQHIGGVVSLRDVPKIQHAGRERVPQAVGLSSKQDDAIAPSRAGKYEVTALTSDGRQIVTAHQEVRLSVHTGSPTKERTPQNQGSSLGTNL
jgi:hypothetical protein